LRFSVNSEMSAPDAKAWVPAPRYTTARTPSSLASSVVTRARSCHMRRLIALRTWGRLKTTVARAPSRRTRMSGSATEAKCSVKPRVIQTDPRLRLRNAEGLADHQRARDDEEQDQPVQLARPEAQRAERRVRLDATEPRQERDHQHEHRAGRDRRALEV